MRTVRLIAAAVCLLIAAGLVIAAGLPDRATANAITTINETPVSPEIGGLAPPIAANDLAGKAVSLAALHGKVVVVNFWATWCGPCIAETPALQAAYAQYHTAGLEIIGVDANESPADVSAWGSHMGVGYPLVIDGNGALMSLYRVRGLPSTYIVGRDGIIADLNYGPVTSQRLNDAIQRLLAG